MPYTIKLCDKHPMPADRTVTADLLAALVSAREYIMTEAEARDYAPPVPGELVAAMDDAIAAARGTSGFEVREAHP